MFSKSQWLNNSAPEKKEKETILLIFKKCDTNYLWMQLKQRHY